MTDPQNPAAQQPTPPAPSTPPAYGEYAASTPPAAPAYQQPAAPAYQQPAYAAPAYDSGAPAPAPGKTLGIVALVLAIVPVGLQIVGLILGIVALVQSKKAGRKNGIALAAIIVSSVLLVLTIIVIILAVVAWNAVGGADLVNQVNACISDPSGTVVVNGITMSCEEVLEQSGR